MSARVIGVAARSSAFAFAFALVLGGAARASASAQSLPAPARPLLPAPPLATSPLGRSLSGAYGALARAGSANPSAATQPSFAYVQALERARSGDISGALAAAHIAQATAQSAALTLPLPAATPPARLAVAPARAAVPLVENGAVLSPQLVVAKQEIELASEISRRPLDGAKAHYRAALDAYLSGDAERARSEARSAFDAAADALSTVK